MSAQTVKCSACGASTATGSMCAFCGSPIVHALGGLGLLSAGKPQLDLAFTKFKKQLRKDPNCPDAHFGMGAYFLKRRLFKEATEHLRQAEKHAPISGGIHYLLAFAYAQWRGWTNVMVKSHAEKAVKLDPKMNEAKSILFIYQGISRARSARNRDHLREALAGLQKAKNLKIRDHLPHIYFFCGETLEKANQLENAVKMYRTARDLGLGEAKVHTRLGMIQKNSGQLKLALHNFEKAHEYDPGNNAVRHQIADLKRKLG